MLKLGIDVGSTTYKAIVLDENNNILFKTYQRHYSKINEAILKLLNEINDTFSNKDYRIKITGSAGLGLSKNLNIEFVQEVIAASSAIKHSYHDIDVCIELGGEDAKIIFFEGDNVEQRMNGSCAGGTGAFIDQMAALLNTSSTGINDLAKNYVKLYPIASRCGVFAKNDIQPLLNQGANKEDLAASIYQAIVNQTITGLAAGKKIRGNICFLGGPLTFSSELRKRFIETLNIQDYVVPENGEVFVAYGAALEAGSEFQNIETLIKQINHFIKNVKNESIKTLPRLFTSVDEYDDFVKRHNSHKVEEIHPKKYKGDAYLGIDGGSTTTKMVLLSENNEIIFQKYFANKGNPIDIMRDCLISMYEAINKDIKIVSAYATGYGEELLKSAFKLDGGEVETICHFEAAKYFMPNVEFVLDIGGQDMKYFKVENNVITSIILNEACSSGCGSFISTFANSLQYEIEDFAKIALYAEHPMDLGSRCTVFMNSGVKQAQAEQATSADISAGLAISVVKNALYKVIRSTDFKKDFGENIVVQGGTFLNDALLRSFEMETKMEVLRPTIAGLMGAFGAALLAKKNSTGKSTVSSLETIKNLSFESKIAKCRLCQNFCPITINTFNDGSKLIAGNRCEKGAGIKSTKDAIPNLYLYKYDKILSYTNNINKKYRGSIGIPLVLNMYENIPFWATFFNNLNYEVFYSDQSSKKLYDSGQESIPSDTVCYPAKIVHGHIESLLQKNPDFIFYPNIPYNFNEDENLQNHYNCPVVASYPELIKNNLDNLDLSKYLDPYLSLNNKKIFVKTFYKSVKNHLNVSKKEIDESFDKALEAYKDFRKDILNHGDLALEYALKTNSKMIVLAGRPYHIDPEINHGIPKLLQSLNCVVLSEDSLRYQSDKTQVLNQWTYHNRLYQAANYIKDLKNAQMIQLVSFGCGLDAITTDEVKAILEKNNKIYSQIKIDEVSNIGAVNIRVRSLLATMGE